MLKIMLRSLAVAGLAATALTLPGTARAQTPEKVTIVVFSFPSLGAFMPPVIKAKKMDTAHGIDINFVERPPDAYTTQFNSGEFQVGGSAAVLTVGLADLRGVKVKYLFNLFDFWGTFVTSNPAVKTIKDLEGKKMGTPAGGAAGGSTRVGSGTSASSHPSYRSTSSSRAIAGASVTTAHGWSSSSSSPASRSRISSAE